METDVLVEVPSVMHLHSDIITAINLHTHLHKQRNRFKQLIKQTMNTKYYFRLKNFTSTNMELTNKGKRTLYLQIST